MAKLRHIQETIDRTTGEIITVQKTFSIKSGSVEEFYITFLGGLNAICALSRPSDIKTLALMCAKAEFNTGIVRLSSGIRSEMCEKLGGISQQGFSNSIGRLKAAGLISGKGGDYEINPHCFWKGTTDERNKLLKNRKMDILLKFKMDTSSKPQEDEI